jgi:hypothetical protein
MAISESAVVIDGLKTSAEPPKVFDGAWMVA